jgi:hypothetical protein
MPDRAHRQELTRLMELAFREAFAMDLQWIGREHFILAILGSNEHSPARATLEHLGITHDELAEGLATSIASADPPVQHSDEDDATTPAAHELMGRAEGLAIGFGAFEVTREHVLIAYLWDDSGLLEGWFDVKREAVLDRLRELGVRVPEGSPPPPSPPWGPRIFISHDDSDAIIGELLTRVPPDSGFGCNHDAESRAWVMANADVGLAAYVDEVLADLGIQPVPQPDKQ